MNIPKNASDFQLFVLLDDRFSSIMRLYEYSTTVTASVFWTLYHAPDRRGDGISFFILFGSRIA